MRIIKFLTGNLLCVLFSLFVFTACGDPEPEPSELNNSASLIKFVFSSSSNPGLGSSSEAVYANGYWHISVDEGTDLSKLVPDISVSTGATIQVDDKPFTPGTAYDFTGNVQTVRVISESGATTKTYKICVKHGIPYIDNQVYAFMNEFNIPGVSVSVMKGTEIKYSSGYGFADVGQEERCTPDHLFRMASISKQFCTMCIMTLKEEGRLKLDDQVFGEKGILKGIYHNITPYHEAITIRHLLSHSSGICKGLSDPAFTWAYRMYSDGTPVPTDTLIQRTLDARQQPDVDGGMVWDPGMGYNYSNVGFCILHRIVEVVSGKDYEAFLKQDVLSKMGITDTHIGGYLNERRPHECIFYMQDGTNGYANPLRQLAGAAGIITSTNQMMRILTFMDGDDTVPDIFTPETLEEMYTPYQYSGSHSSYGASYRRYGLGWRMNHSYLFPGAHYHGGNIAGTATFWVGNTDRHMSGAFVCNSRAYNNNSKGESIDTSMMVLLDGFMNYFDN